MVNSYKCIGNFNTLDNVSSRIYVQNKIENVDLRVFNMKTWINEWKILTRHISCAYRFKFISRKSNSNEKWNDNKSWCECKNPRKHGYKKEFCLEF